MPLEAGMLQAETESDSACTCHQRRWALQSLQVQLHDCPTRTPGVLDAQQQEMHGLQVKRLV